ncbi:hypothetical protein ACT2E5_30795 [Burkholderia vietnamiensis]|uniref:hypothetical protein n=1 Tax=Burkholderia vietnamiensis TaxID=60552 RepID=UPI00402AFF66
MAPLMPVGDGMVSDGLLVNLSELGEGGSYAERHRAGSPRPIPIDSTEWASRVIQRRITDDPEAFGSHEVDRAC